MAVVNDREASWAQDFAGGLVVAAVGLGAIAIGQSYGIGSLRKMEPGFFPVALGAFLALIGLGMAAFALQTRAEQAARGERDTALFERPDGRGWFFIVLGVLAFLFVGEVGGLAPAAFLCVFLSALGDRTMSWRRALVFGLIVTVLGCILFSLLLGIQMPLVAGWPS